jgi:hypothetical protein
MPAILYNPVIDLGAALFLVGIALAALRGVRRFAWIMVLGVAVGVGGWLLPVPSAQLGALLHFPAAKTALRSVPVSQIKAIAAGKAPASELTPQYVAGLKLDPSASGFSGFNGEAKAIADSPMAHDPHWAAKTVVLAVLEGNGPLATALGYGGTKTGAFGAVTVPQGASMSVVATTETAKEVNSGAVNPAATTFLEKHGVTLQQQKQLIAESDAYAAKIVAEMTGNAPIYKVYFTAAIDGKTIPMVAQVGLKRANVKGTGIVSMAEEGSPSAPYRVWSLSIYQRSPLSTYGMR